METLSNIIQRYLQDVDNRNIWYYYTGMRGEELEFRNIDDLLHDPGGFVRRYLLKGSKEPEISPFLDDDRFKPRMTHTVSIFFLGIILYNQVQYIKKCIDKYLISLEIEIMEKDPQHEFIKVPFRYYWFLVCFYHDLGYFSIKNEKIMIFNNDTWEGRELEVRSILEKLIDKGTGIPSFIINNSFNYLEYRKEQFINHQSNEPIDHGFLSGTYYYYNREIKFHEIFSRVENLNKDRCIDDTGLHWSRYLMDVVHPTISWNIISHNIWFKKEVDGKNYRDRGLNDLISNRPKVKLNEFPLYFVLCFVDTIDFVKNFIEEYPIDLVTKTKEVLENISFDTTLLRNSFKIQINNFDRKRYLTKMKNNEYWLGFQVDQMNDELIFSVS
jgi:hypothetical protein